MRRVGAAVAALLALLAAATSTLGAQEPDTLRLTLEEALARAEASSPAYRRAANDLELRRVERQATWANEVLPRVSLTVLNTDYGGFLTRQATDFFGNPIENPDAAFVYSSGTQQGIRLDWTVRGRSLLNALHRQSVTELQREVSARAALNELATSVRRSWFAALAQDALLDMERELTAARRVELDLADRLFSLAATTRVDVLNARLEVEQQLLRARQQERAREQATLELRTAIGDERLPAIVPVAGRLPVFDPSLLDDDALVARAAAGSPASAAAVAAVRAGEVGVHEARESWWPEIRAGFGMGRRIQGLDTNALFDLGGFGDDLYTSFRLELGLPFFSDPFGNRSRAAAAELELDDRRQSLREARLRVEQDVRSALVALRNQHETLQIAERSRAIAQEALELAREEYKIVSRTFEQLQQAIDQEREARRQVITARYGFLDALVTLEDAVGGPVAPETGAASGPAAGRPNGAGALDDGPAAASR